MNKLSVRTLKSHYQDRWQVMKYNRKSVDKVLLIEDALMLKMLLPGPTLFYRCLGEMFYGIHSDVHVQPVGLFHNIVMINNVEFKYLKVDQIYHVIEAAVGEHLAPAGQVFCTFSHRYLVYDRVSQTIESAFGSWKQNKLKLTKFRNMTNRSRLSFGDIWCTLRYD